MEHKETKAMTKAQLLKKIALLESVNDHLQTEVENLDAMMRLVGFAHGIATVKATAQEMIDKGISFEIVE